MDEVTTGNVPLRGARGGHRMLGPGVESHPLYGTWGSIVQRCTNPNVPHYANYGGRGIGIAPQWRRFSEFARDVHLSIGGRPAGFTLDRIDNDRGYEPGNIRWADARTQMNNRQFTRRAEMHAVEQERDMWRERAISLGWTG